MATHVDLVYTALIQQYKYAATVQTIKRTLKYIANNLVQIYYIHNNRIPANHSISGNNSGYNTAYHIQLTEELATWWPQPRGYQRKPDNYTSDHDITLPNTFNHGH